MSVRYPQFQGEVVLLAKIHYANTNLAAEMSAISTFFASDTTTHDRTIQTPPAGLLSDAPAANQSRLTRDLLNLVNIGKAGNLPTASIIAAIDGVAGVLFPPGNIDVPYVSAAPYPPASTSTVCSCTQGNWAGTPSSYAYAWYRNGVVIAGATSATYQLVSADIGGKQITCVVTATNATPPPTAAPPSNAIAT